MTIKSILHGNTQLLDALDEAIVLLDHQGLIVYANLSACQTLNMQQEQLINKHLNEHLALDESQKDNIQAICLEQRGENILKRSFICGYHVKKIQLDTPIEQAQSVLIWHKTNLTATTRDQSTGLPDRNMLIHQLKPLLSQSTLSHPHSLIRIQILRKNAEPIGFVLPEQLESLMTDIAALLAPNIRQRDLLSRTEPDCFMLLLRGCDLEHTQHIAHKLLSEIKSYHADYPDTSFPEWRACTGITPLVPGKTVDETFQQLQEVCQNACAKQDKIAILIEDNWENVT